MSDALKAAHEAIDAYAEHTHGEDAHIPVGPEGCPLRDKLRLALDRAVEEAAHSGPCDSFGICLACTERAGRDMYEQSPSQKARERIAELESLLRSFLSWTEPDHSGPAEAYDGLIAEARAVLARGEGK